MLMTMMINQSINQNDNDDDDNTAFAEYWTLTYFSTVAGMRSLSVKQTLNSYSRNIITSIKLQITK